mmetsp:Transcript_27475/g.74329  ORF Transcript_27475/g.74329 Transcript_27475/m.74329 type:complete len:208 (+) Transcript_27475:2121-2744(+)
MLPSSSVSSSSSCHRGTCAPKLARLSESEGSCGSGASSSPSSPSSSSWYSCCWLPSCARFLGAPLGLLTKGWCQGDGPCSGTHKARAEGVRGTEGRGSTPAAAPAGGGGGTCGGGGNGWGMPSMDGSGAGDWPEEVGAGCVLRCGACDGHADCGGGDGVVAVVMPGCGECSGLGLGGAARAAPPCLWWPDKPDVAAALAGVVTSLDM